MQRRKDASERRNHDLRTLPCSSSQNLTTEFSTTTMCKPLLGCKRGPLNCGGQIGLFRSDPFHRDVQATGYPRVMVRRTNKCATKSSHLTPAIVSVAIVKHPSRAGASASIMFDPVKATDRTTFGTTLFDEEEGQGYPQRRYADMSNV